MEVNYGRNDEFEFGFYSSCRGTLRVEINWKKELYYIDEDNRSVGERLETV